MRPDIIHSAKHGHAASTVERGQGRRWFLADDRETRGWVALAHKRQYIARKPQGRVDVGPVVHLAGKSQDGWVGRFRLR